MANPEFSLQSQVTGYIRSQYPRVLFRSDLIALANLPVQTASMMKRMQCARGWPDLVVYETVMIDEAIWTGLCQEMKTDRKVIFNRDGSIKADQLFHVLEQQANLSMLWARGLAGTFYFGFEDTCNAIDQYLAKSFFDWDRALGIYNLCMETVRHRPELLINERLDPFVARWYSDKLGF